MEKGQQGALIVTFVMFALLIGGAYLMGRSGPATIRSIDARRASSTVGFSKRSEGRREPALRYRDDGKSDVGDLPASVSPSRESTESSAQGEARTDAEAAPSAVTGESSAPPPVDVERRIDEIVKKQSPEMAAARLEELLASLDNIEQTGRVYSTLAMLYARREPPDYARAEACLAAAGKGGGAEEPRLEAALGLAEAYLDAGKTDEAARQAEAIIEEPGPPSVTRLRLRVLDAVAHEKKGAAEAAEMLYRQAADEALDSAEALGPQALGVYRQACLLLVRMLQDSDRADAADVVVSAMKAKLGRVTAP